MAHFKIKFLVLGVLTLHTAFTVGYSQGKLIWADEFNGQGKPVSKKWEIMNYNRRNNPNGPDGWWDPDDVFLDGNGHLVIRVRKITNRNNDNDPHDYSVGAIRTKGKFENLYGRYEIRCQLPKKVGWWVAFWMMLGNVSSEENGGIDGAEVDIMEAWGWIDRINHAIHWDGYGEHLKSEYTSLQIPGIRTGFHTFALEWYPDKYIFYIDGKETWRHTDQICNQPGYLKITGEISTKPWLITENWANNPEEANYPDAFFVDYVRVYKITP